MELPSVKHVGCGGLVRKHTLDGGQRIALICDECHHSIQIPSLELTARGGFKPEKAERPQFDQVSM